MSLNISHVKNVCFELLFILIYQSHAWLYSHFRQWNFPTWEAASSYQSVGTFLRNLETKWTTFGNMQFHFPNTKWPTKEMILSLKQNYSFEKFNTYFEKKIRKKRTGGKTSQIYRNNTVCESNKTRPIKFIANDEMMIRRWWLYYQ